ncbi:MAG: hypothetical protein R3C45_12405 [Phycisphaerales bacterium]
MNCLSTKGLHKLTAVYAVLLIHLCALSPVLAQVAPIEGDLNDDGFVGIVDLNIVLGQWNHGDNGIVSGPPLEDPRADPSGDGYVGIADLNIILGNWNAGYQPGQDFKGMNLHKVRYWSREWMFVDIMKRAREWTLSNPATNTDVNGWPELGTGDTAETVLINDSPGYPTGTYVCTFTGSGGTINFSLDATNIQVVSPGRITFDVNSATGNGIHMTITGINPNDHIRDVKVWMPGFENASSPFHPLFVKRLRPFSVIRFMDWQRTNDVDEVSWSARTTPASFSQGSDDRLGVALEHMVELCNQLEADPWFCMPHKADNAYVANFATYVRENLDPKLKVYVEWSNEVWNPGFNAYKWIRKDAIPGDNNDVELGAPEFYNMWANEAGNDFEVWHDVFAANGQQSRLIRVLAGQAANVDVAEQLADRLKIRTFPEQFDAISCAAYFGHRVGKLNLVFDANTTPQDVIDHAMTVTIPESKAWYKEHGNIGDGITIPKSGLAWEMSSYFGRPIKFLAYEAGQHYTPQGNDSLPYLQALYDAQDHVGENGNPGIYEAYIENLTAFEEAGGKLFMTFNYVSKQDDKNGSWGHLEKQDQPNEDAHKFRAVLDYNPRP